MIFLGVPLSIGAPGKTIESDNIYKMSDFIIEDLNKINFEKLKRKQTVIRVKNL